MSNKPNLAVLALFCCAVLVSIATAASAQETSEPAASTYANPDDVEVRDTARDIEPVYRGPSVDTLATIRKRGVLRVGVVVTEPAVMHDADGNLIGASIDLGRHLAEDMGVDVEFVQTSWSRVIPDLLARHFDLIASNLWVTPERALVVNYSDATATEGIYLIANKELAAGMTSHDDFNRPEVKIVVYEGTVQEEVAKRHFPEASLVLIEGDEMQEYPVLEGKAHAVLVPTFAPQVLVGAAPDKLFVPLERPLESTITAIAVRKGDYDFVNYLNSWLQVQRDDGWLEDRIDFWADPRNWAE